MQPTSPERAGFRPALSDGDREVEHRVQPGAAGTRACRGNVRWERRRAQVADGAAAFVIARRS
jgi:hypothetical protein